MRAEATFRSVTRSRKVRFRGCGVSSREGWPRAISDRVERCDGVRAWVGMSRSARANGQGCATRAVAPSSSAQSRVAQAIAIAVDPAARLPVRQNLRGERVEMAVDNHCVRRGSLNEQIRRYGCCVEWRVRSGAISAGPVQVEALCRRAAARCPREHETSSIPGARTHVLFQFWSKPG